MAVRDRCTVCSITHAIVYFIYIANTFFRTFLEKSDYWASNGIHPNSLVFIYIILKMAFFLTMLFNRAWMSFTGTFQTQGLEMYSDIHWNGFC